MACGFYFEADEKIIEKVYLLENVQFTMNPKDGKEPVDMRQTSWYRLATGISHAIAVAPIEGSPAFLAYDPTVNYLNYFP